ncbi:MAG: hypothetical protein FWE62_04495, partial [Firmicutes bacterium]|nr:hypothetical protein [Bacillota bacterium]
DGYISEQESIVIEVEEEYRRKIVVEERREQIQSEPPKRPLTELLAELSNYPEFQELLKKMSTQGHENGMQAQ